MNHGQSSAQNMAMLSSHRQSEGREEALCERVYFFGTEIRIFLREMGKSLPQPYDEDWVMTVTFYADRTF